jgi:ribosomal protein S18 acetylase RimI-like enzyme
MIEGVSFDIVPNGSALRLRPAIPTDASFVRHLFGEVCRRQFLATGLSGPLLDQVIAQQFNSQSEAYAAQFPDAISLIIMQRAAVVGRLLLYCASERWHIIDIALKPADCGRGLGSEIIDALAASARQRGVGALTLSVLTGNLAARRFYLRHGFTETGQAGAAHIAMRRT